MPEITSTVPERVVLRRQYQDVTFQAGQVLPASELGRFQNIFAHASGIISNTLSGYMNWVVIDSEGDPSVTNYYVDSIFTENVAASPNDSDWYSHGESARETTKTPDFPQYFTFNSGDRIYFGHRWPFGGMIVIHGTLGSATISPTWTYWDGTSWTALAGLVDGTSGFSSNGTITWTVPGDWDLSTIDDALSITDFTLDAVPRFWVRVESGANPGTRPEISQVRRNTRYTGSLLVIPTSPVSGSVIVQPGLAIVGSNVIVVDDYQTVDLSANFDPVNNRVAVIQLQQDGTISTTLGAAAASPVTPEPRRDAIKLADVVLTGGGSTIAGGNITDARIKYDAAGL